MGYMKITYSELVYRESATKYLATYHSPLTRTNQLGTLRIQEGKNELPQGFEPGPLDLYLVALPLILALVVFSPFKPQLRLFCSRQYK